PGDVVALELGHDPAAVALDGLDAEPEDLGDLRARLALADQGQDLALALGQAVAGIGRLVAELAAAVAKQDHRDRGREERLAAGDRPDRLDQIRQARALEQVAARA